MMHAFLREIDDMNRRPVANRFIININWFLRENQTKERPGISEKFAYQF